MDYANSECKDNSVTFFVTQSGHRINPALLVRILIVEQYSLKNFLFSPDQTS